MHWRPALVIGVFSSVVPLAATPPQATSSTLTLASQARVPATIDPSITVYEPRSDNGYVMALQTLMPLVDATFGVEAFSKKGYALRYSGRTLPIAGRTVAEILDDLDRAWPTYSWRDENGVILIEPNQAGPSFLETTVTEFNVQNETVGSAVCRLARWFDSTVPISNGYAFDMPYFLDPNKAGRPSLASISGTQRRGSLALKDMTARDILSRVASAFHSRFWLVQHFDGSRGYPNSQIRLEIGDGVTSSLTTTRR